MSEVLVCRSIGGRHELWGLTVRGDTRWFDFIGTVSRPQDFRNRVIVPDASEGHTFFITVTSRGSYAVVGEPGHTDADHFGPPMTVDVRAWDLPTALRKAAAVPLNEWGFEEDVDAD